MFGTRIYKVWDSMMTRTTKPTNKSYRDYGGRGITVCKKWRDFRGFFEDMKDSYKENLTLDRINNSKGYSKSNCRWSTPKEQARNTRRNHGLTFRGKTQCISAWSEELGFKDGLILSRLKKGWSVQKTLTTPVIKK